MHRFIGEGATAGYHTDNALLMDEPRHDTDLCFIDRDHAGTVRTDQTDITSTERALHFYHVVHWDAFGDTNDQFDPSVSCFQNCIGAKRRRHKDERGVALLFLHRIADRIKDGNALDLLTGLPRGHARHHLGSVSLALGRVERAFLP